MNRNETIEHVLKDLRILKISGSFKNQYAIEENIKFFESIRTTMSYVWWLIARATKLDRKNILEITDLPFPRWDREMHTKLIEVEKRDFPGLVRPLVNEIVAFIIKENRPMVLVNLGCGGMEIDRQVIQRLLNIKHDQKIIFVGVDKSLITHEIAKRNLKEIEPNIDIFEVDTVEMATLNNIKDSGKNTHAVILCKNNIFQLDRFFPKKYFDLVYHAFFWHHVSQEQQARLTEIIRNISKEAFEYDGYRSWLHLIPKTLTAWKYPAFLNGSVLSNFRYYKKKELKLRKKTNTPHVYSIGTYLLKL